MAIISFNGFSFDPETQLTKNFKVKDFIKTDTGLQNYPNQAQYNNIKNILAPTMQKLYDDIGPFKIISAFRTKEVQQKVSGKITTTVSFHEAALAVDILPTTMPIDIYFGKILASSVWMEKLYEIFLKPPQNTIHLSVSVDSRKGLVKIMNDEKTSYVAATLDQIQSYIEDAVGSAGRAIASIVSGENKTGRNVIMASTGLIALLLFLSPRKKDS